MRKSIRQFFQTNLYEMSFYVEILISIILVTALLVLTGRLGLEVVHILNQQTSIEDYIQGFLNQAMSIAIGVELIKMLTKHTTSTVVEVLLFAIARQIVVNHGSALDSLLSVMALVALLAARKYLLSNFDDVTTMIVRGSHKIGLVNILAKVKLKGNKQESLRDFMMRHLAKEDKIAVLGETIVLQNIALRIDSMRDDKITRVEIIKLIS